MRPQTTVSIYLKAMLPRVAVVLLFVLGFSFIASAQRMQAPTAQRMQKATIDTEGVIKIDESTQLSYAYEFDIEAMNFKSEQEAVQYFKKLNDQLCTYIVDYQRQKVELNIEYRMKPGWDAKRWNQYLSERSSRQ